MKEITLHDQWLIKAPIEDVFRMMTSFEKFPEYFPKVAESIQIKKREGNYVEMDAIVSSFGQKFPVRMKTRILPGKGFISDNDSFKFGTSGHEKMLLSKSPEGTLIDYNYRVSIHKAWMSWGDTYELDISDDTDEITALAVVLAIDTVLDNANNSANG